MTEQELSQCTILVTGGNGFLGKHVVTRLTELGVPSAHIRTPSSNELDLRDQEQVRTALHDVDVVLHLAAHVGGIGYNRAHPATILYDNLLMGTHIIHEAYAAGVRALTSVGTVCSYPKHTTPPFRETSLWDGYPEESNAAYGLSKKMQLVQAIAYWEEYGFSSAYLVPTNLYGPGDNFDPASSHVIPALIRKIAAAHEIGETTVEVWGSGSATRDFLFVRDAAQAIISATLAEQTPEPINLGSGREVSIRELVEVIAELLEFRGTLQWDKTKPDGQPRRVLDTTRAEELLGFHATTDLRSGLQESISYYYATHHDQTH